MDQLALAKDLFRKGVALLNTDDVERALDYFLRSRAAVPSARNTANAAICLHRLGRYDEALEMYEELLLRFSADLDAEDRETLGPAMAALRAKVGGLTLSANVDGLVVIDGRARGKLPFSAPVRVLGGKHTVRVFKEGYAAFEARIDVPVGGSVAVDARLEPVAGAGLLRVEGSGSEGFDVFIDGARAGKIPWEGTVGLGRHLVWIEKGDRGSAPAGIAVLQGQAALAQLAASDLGPPVRVETTPPSARIAIDGVLLGTSFWQGRLPVGSHQLGVAEEGYRSRRIALVVRGGGTAVERVSVALSIDPDDPRWPRVATGRPFVALFGAFAGGPTLHAGAEEACPARCFTEPTVGGGLGGVRGGFRFKLGLAPEIAVGYMSFGASFTRSASAAFESRATGQTYPVDYTLDDRLRVAGPFVGAGASFRVALRPELGLLARTTLGVLAARVSDPITGTARTTTGTPVPIAVSDRDQTLPAAMPFVLPELGAEASLGPVRVAATLGIAFFPAFGPRFSHTDTGVTPRCTADRPGDVGCAPIAAVVAGERAFAPFLLWTPQLSVGYVF